jgi:ribosome-dependent ATPase
MTQAFSLYGELTVRENLVLDARLYHIPPDKAKARIEELVERFGLGPHIDAQTDSLPMGLKQRLSLAVAVLHEPQILILDEPTSGVDPVARDSFWELLVDLSRNQGVTIFITTHFMNEGLRCDRISLMNSGKVLACDAPQKLIESRKAANLEDAFIAYMEEGIAAAAKEAAAAKAAAAPAAGAPEPAAKEKAATEKGAEAPPAAADQPAKGTLIPLPLRRMLAYARNETAQIQRDPVRLTFAFVGSALLMLLFGFGITSDVKNIRYTVLDRDQTAESRGYIEQFRGSPEYFATTPALLTDQEGLERLQADDVTAIVEIPPSFGRDLRRGSAPEILAQVDGANPFRGETVAQYVRGVHQMYLSDPSSGFGGPPRAPTASIEARFMYNPTVESIYSVVPSVPALLLILIPAILMTVAIVREKELGSMINFYVTPTARIEYLLGKQLPYVAIGMINYFILAAIALIVFAVPIKGSFLVLTVCTLLYVIVTTQIGMLVSTFTSTQVAAVFVTAILTIQPTVQFAGLLQPVSTLEGGAKIIGSIWPTTYYMHSSVGAYTKGLSAELMLQDLIFLAACIPVLWTVSALLLRKQER